MSDLEHDYWYPGDGTPQNCRHDQNLKIGTSIRLIKCALCGKTSDLPANWHAIARERYLYLQPPIRHIHTLPEDNWLH